MDLTYKGMSDFLVLKTEGKKIFFADEFLKNISIQNDTTATKYPQETCFRDNEFTCILSTEFYGF